MYEIIHPCFESEGCGYRFHLPIAPKCNTQCNFCKKGISDLEIRPGVTKTVLHLEDIDAYMQKNIDLYPQCKIVGVAGPGDPLSNPDVLFETYKLLDEKYPEFKKCMCTNGFYLSDYKDEFINSKLDYITLTVNSRNANTLAKIYDFLEYRGKLYSGIEMGQLILKLQEEALKIIVSETNIKLKINIVVIPDINDGELTDLIAYLKKYNVHIFNLIPVLNVKGTKFENIKMLSHEEINKIKEDLKKRFPDVKFKNNCQRCRADACGYIGCKNKE